MISISTWVTKQRDNKKSETLIKKARKHGSSSSATQSTATPSNPGTNGHESPPVGGSPVHSVTMKDYRPGPAKPGEGQYDANFDPSDSVGKILMQQDVLWTSGIQSKNLSIIRENSDEIIRSGDLTPQNSKKSKSGLIDITYIPLTEVVEEPKKDEPIERDSGIILEDAETSEVVERSSNHDEKKMQKEAKRLRKVQRSQIRSIREQRRQERLEREQNQLDEENKELKNKKDNRSYIKNDNNSLDKQKDELHSLSKKNTSIHYIEDIRSYSKKDDIISQNDEIYSKKSISKNKDRYHNEESQSKKRTSRSKVEDLRSKSKKEDSEMEQKEKLKSKKYDDIQREIESLKEKKEKETPIDILFKKKTISSKNSTDILRRHPMFRDIASYDVDQKPDRRAITRSDELRAVQRGFSAPRRHSIDSVRSFVSKSPSVIAREELQRSVILPRPITSPNEYAFIQENPILNNRLLPQDFQGMDEILIESILQKKKKRSTAHSGRTPFVALAASRKHLATSQKVNGPLMQMERRTMEEEKQKQKSSSNSDKTKRSDKSNKKKDDTLSPEQKEREYRERKEERNEERLFFFAEQPVRVQTSLPRKVVAKSKKQVVPPPVPTQIVVDIKKEKSQKRSTSIRKSEAINRNRTPKGSIKLKSELKVSEVLGMIPDELAKPTKKTDSKASIPPIIIPSTFRSEHNTLIRRPNEKEASILPDSTFILDGNPFEPEPEFLASMNNVSELDLREDEVIVMDTTFPTFSHRISEKAYPKTITKPNLTDSAFYDMVRSDDVTPAHIGVELKDVLLEHMRGSDRMRKVDSMDTARAGEYVRNYLAPTRESLMRIPISSDAPDELQVPALEDGAEQYGEEIQLLQPGEDQRSQLERSRPELNKNIETRQQVYEPVYDISPRIQPGPSPKSLNKSFHFPEQPSSFDIIPHYHFEDKIEKEKIKKSIQKPNYQYETRVSRSIYDFDQNKHSKNDRNTQLFHEHSERSPSHRYSRLNNIMTPKSLQSDPVRHGSHHRSKTMEPTTPSVVPDHRTTTLLSDNRINHHSDYNNVYRSIRSIDHSLSRMNNNSKNNMNINQKDLHTSQDYKQNGRVHNVSRSKYSLLSVAQECGPSFSPRRSFIPHARE